MTGLEFVGAATGIVGTVLLALNGPRARWGFAAYFVSNIAWIQFAIDKQHTGLLIQQCAFLLATVLGMYTWLVKTQPTSATSTDETIYGPDLHTELLAA